MLASISLAASNYYIKKGVVTLSLALCFVFSKSCFSPCIPAHTHWGGWEKSDGVSPLHENGELKGISRLES